MVIKALLGLKVLKLTFLGGMATAWLFIFFLSDLMGWRELGLFLI